MTPAERDFYKEKMKKIKEAKRLGNEAMAKRHADELLVFFNAK